MKKIFICLLSAAIFTACGGNETKQDTKPVTENTGTKPAGPDMSDNPDYKAGLALVSGSDCFTCHKVDEKLNGPAYRDIANKYATAGDTILNYLSNKIIKGGSGVWGEIMMTPHPGLAEADAKAMAKYVLLLKNN